MSRRADDGVTTVEFSLILPLLILLLSIGFFFGWTVYEQAQLDRAASRAARYAAVPTNTGLYAFCSSDVLKQINSDLYSGQAKAAEVTVTDVNGTPAPDCSATTYNKATDYKVPVLYVRVRIAHDYTNPFRSLLAIFTPISDVATITGSSEVRVETS